MDEDEYETIDKVERGSRWTESEKACWPDKRIFWANLIDPTMQAEQSRESGEADSDWEDFFVNFCRIVSAAALQMMQTSNCE